MCESGVRKLSCSSCSGDEKAPLESGSIVVAESNQVSTQQLYVTWN